MDESIDTNDLEPANTEQLTGLGGFLQSLAGYYARFLETDFKKQRQPKRKFESSHFCTVCLDLLGLSVNLCKLENSSITYWLTQ